MKKAKLREKALRALYPMSRSTLWRWMEDKGFPKPEIVGVRTTYWDGDEVEQWFKERDRMLNEIRSKRKTKPHFSKRPKKKR